MSVRKEAYRADLILVQTLEAGETASMATTGDYRKALLEKKKKRDCLILLQPRPFYTLPSLTLYKALRDFIKQAGDPHSKESKEPGQATKQYQHLV